MPAARSLTETGSTRVLHIPPYAKRALPVVSNPGGPPTGWPHQRDGRARCPRPRRKRKGRPVGRPFFENRRPSWPRRRLNSGADLHECRDPGHGSGGPRLVVRHRITSFLVVEPRRLMYGRAAPPTSDLRQTRPTSRKRRIRWLPEPAFEAAMHRVTMRRSANRVSDIRLCRRHPSSTARIARPLLHGMMVRLTRRELRHGE